MATAPTKPRDHHGRLELTWTNKDMAYVQTAEGDYDYRFVDPSDHRVNEVRLLHELSSHAADTPEDLPEGHPTPTTDNLLINGDSMHALRALAHLPEYAEKYRGKVKLVYLDPPFNTGHVFDNYDDNLPHSIWLTMMRDRFRQIKELLSNDGSVWVHLDDSEVHRARCVMDEVFGADNFVAEVVWEKTRTYRNDAKGMSVSHDTILVYRKTEAWSPNPLDRTAAMDATYSSPDGDPVPWAMHPTHAPGARTHQGMVYAIEHPLTGEMIYPPRGRHWSHGKERLLAALNEYAEYVEKDINDDNERASRCGLSVADVRKGVTALVLAVPLDTARESTRHRLAQGVLPDIIVKENSFSFKKHLPSGGVVPDTLWTADIAGTNAHAKNEVKALFPGTVPFATPKPERLLQRIIHIGSNPGDIVLDPFGGSGTTAAVAHKMGRRWVTCELLEDTFEAFTKARLLKVVNGEDGGGISTATERVAAEGTELPGNTSPEEAALFNTILTRAAKQLGDDVDAATIKALKAVTRTKDVTTVNWVGGGGFTAVKVGPSMFDAEDGYVFLADWATKSALARAVCAQIGVRYVPNGIFCGTKGFTHYVVVDGMVNTSTLDAIISQTPDGTPVHVWATQFVPDAEKHLRRARRGSKVNRIPTNLIERYRRTHRRNRFNNNNKNGAQL